MTNIQTAAIAEDLAEGVDLAAPPIGDQPYVPPGAIEVAGKLYLTNRSGDLTPLEMVKPEDLIRDEMVRKIMGFAQDLSAQISRFMVHTKDDIEAYKRLMDQEYGVTKSAPGGNAQFTTFDGLMRVVVKRAKLIEYGPQLQQAKSLVNEYLNEKAAEADPEVRAIITRAFNTDRQGDVDRTELQRLKKLNITDPRWLRAMQAIADAEDVIGSKDYLHFQIRDRQDGKFEAVTINLAKA